MVRTILIPALTTGAFCAGFAVFVDYATDMLHMWQVIFVSGLSGFLGSLFASLVWNRKT